MQVLVTDRNQLSCNLPRRNLLNLLATLYQNRVDENPHDWRWPERESLAPPTPSQLRSQHLLVSSVVMRD